MTEAEFLRLFENGGAVRCRDFRQRELTTLYLSEKFSIAFSTKRYLGDSYYSEDDRYMHPVLSHGKVVCCNCRHDGYANGVDYEEVEDIIDPPLSWMSDAEFDGALADVLGVVM